MEGGWFSSVKHGNTPTNRLEIPAEWTEILLKTAIGLGLDNFNIYMFHGGSNPGYYTGKYISTSYDFSAAIREWGELSNRYFNVKRTYLFLNAFNEEIERTEFAKEVFKQASTCSDIFQRVGEYLSIIVLRNMGDFPCYQRLIYDNRVIPGESSILIKPRYAKILVFNYTLRNTPFKLEYTSAEILTKTEFDKTHVLVLYNEPGEESETAITTSERLSSIFTLGSIRVSKAQESFLIKLVHNDLDNIVVLESVNGSRLIIVYTSRRRAERTWVINNGIHSFIVISNIYYTGSSNQLGRIVELEVELDRDSCGYVTLISSKPIDTVVLNNSSEYSLEKITDHVYRFFIPTELCKEQVKSEYVVDNLFIKEDPVEHQFMEIEPGTPLEKIGFYDNGLYIYKIKWSLSRDLISSLQNGIIALSNFNDYAVLSLNKYHLASGYHYVEANAIKHLREGNNELTILLESTGHPNDGLLYVPNGITGDLYLEKTISTPLIKWRRIELKPPYGPGFDMSDFLERPIIIKEVLTNWRNFDSIEVYDIDTPGLYIKEITINDIRGNYLIDPGESFYYNHYYRVLLFVNGEYLGPLKGPIDISKHLKQGLNELALYVEWGVVSPRLVAYKYKLHGKWWVQKDTYGLINEWYRNIHSVGFDNQASLPMVIRNNGGKVFWFNANIEIEKEPDTSRPRYIQVKSEGLRLLVFFNGNLIGRIYDESPVKSLYIPEPVIRKGLNEITLLGVVTSNLAVLESIKISEYFVNNKARIKFYLEEE
ncbi:MAG: beta-galactosidase, partial [Desulfurococcaceae archaeon]